MTERTRAPRVTAPEPPEPSWFPTVGIIAIIAVASPACERVVTVFPPPGEPKVLPTREVTRW